MARLTVNDGHHDDPGPAPRVDLGPASKVVESARAVVRGGRIEPDELIPLLQRIQNAYGYLPPTVLAWLSEQTGIPTSRIHGVATFYAQFYLEPHGKHTVRCCRGTACHVKGGRKVIDTVSRTLGLGDGETSRDLKFSFETVACLGTCAISPVMVVDGAYFGKTTPRKAEGILEAFVRQEQ